MSCSCRLCGKHFNTKNSFENHLKSKKHRDVAARDDADVQVMNSKNIEDSARSATVCEKETKEATNAKLEKMQVEVVANVELDAGTSTGGAEGTMDICVKEGKCFDNKSKY